MRLPLKLWIGILNPKWIMIALSGYLVVIVFGALFLLQPQSQRYEDALEKQLGLDDTYVNLITFDVQSAIDIIMADLEGLRLLKSDFENRLLKDKDPESILPIIEGYCSRTRLKVVDLQVLDQNTPLPPHYDKRFVRISLRGEYSDFLGFLKRLESNPEWILIESLVIQHQQGGSVTQFDLDLSLLAEKHLKYDQYGIPDLDVQAREVKLVKRDQAQANKRIATARKSPQPSPAIPTTMERPWVVQVGAFSKDNNAKRVQQLLIQNGYQVQVEVVVSHGRPLHAVRVISYGDKQQASVVGQELQEKFGLDFMVIKRPE